MAIPAQTDPTPLRKPTTAVRYRQLGMQPLKDLSLPFLVRAVLNEHDLGQFARSALLWEQIRRDDRCKAVLSVRVNALIGLDVALSPPPGLEENAEAQAVADAAREVWSRFSSHAERSQILSWALGVGFAYGRVNWETTAGKWIPRLEVWHPCFVSWHEDSKSFWVNAEEGQIEITPGRDGWWLFAPFGYQRGWAEGYVNALSMPYLSREWAYRDWCRYNEVHGLPMIKAIIPQGAEDDDEVGFAFALADRASAPVISVPQDAQGKGFDFELVEAKADTWQAFQGMKADANVDIAVSVLGQNLSTEVSGGSYAASKVQDKVRGDILASDARAMEEFFRDQILAPWAAYNVAQGEDFTPSVRFTVEEVADLALVGDGLTKFGAGILATKNAGVQLDVDELTKRSDIPTKGPAGEPAPPPAPVVAAAPPGKAKLNLAASEGTGALPTADNTQEQGQAYADAIVATFTEKAARSMDPDRLKLLSVVLQAESLEELPKLIEHAYAEMNSDELAGLTKLALMEAELNGWYSARGI